MGTVATLLALGAIAFGAVALLMLLFPSKRARGRRQLVLSFLVFIVAIAMMPKVDGPSSKRADPTADGGSASTAPTSVPPLGESPPALPQPSGAAGERYMTWEQLQKDPEALKARQERIAREAKADAEAKKSQAAGCWEDLQCLGDKHSIEASFPCSRAVERLAQFDFEWTDGFLGPKFTHFRWKSKKAGIVTYIGDEIKFQNGFGAMQYHTYYCDYDTNKKTVVDVFAISGRMKQ